MKPIYLVMVAIEVQAQSLAEAEKQVEQWHAHLHKEDKIPTAFLDIYLPSKEPKLIDGQRVFLAPVDSF